MTLNFPSSPTTGQTHNATNGLSYYYDGVKWTSAGTYSSSAETQPYKIDDISSDFNGSTTTFNLHHNSIDVSITNALDVQVSIGGVLQEPDVGYTVNSTASTITFSEAPETGTKFFGIVFTRTPSSDVVTSVNSNTGAITAAQIASAVEAASDSNTFTDADHSKLNAIAASANNYSISSDLLDEDNMASDSATKVPSQQSVKAYVDGATGTATNLSATANGTSLTVESSSGNNVSLPAATTSAWGVMSDDDKTKLDGIETSATADQTNAEIRTAVEAATDSNVFTDADHTKLNGIEASATADQSNAEIRAAVEAATDSNVFTDADHSKLNAIEASADVTDATNVNTAGAVMNSDLDGKGEILIGDGSGDPTALAVGTNNYILTADSGEATGVKWAAAGAGGDANQNAFSNIAVSGQDTVAADSTTDTLNIAAGSNVTITTTAGSDTVTIASTDTNTTYSVGDGGLTQNNFTNTLKTKLDGIEASATADQSNAEIRAAVEAASDSNVFTDADHTKLNGIEASATADQSNAEIRTAVEAASDSNVFTDADHTKLNGITASANNYVHPNHSGEVTSTADGATVIADDVVDEANLKISNAGSNGQYLQKQSGDTGGLTWATVSGGGGVTSDSDFNTVAGTSAGEDLQSGEGERNTFFGKDAGMNVTTGDDNVAIGESALKASTTASHNVAIGRNAGQAITTGHKNILLGAFAGAAVTEATHSNCIGYLSGTAITTGDRNTYIGGFSGEATTTGSYNIALGFEAAEDLTTGQKNVFIGYEAGRESTINQNCVAIGYQALRDNVDGNDASWEGMVAIGMDAGRSNTGKDNTFVGFKAGMSSGTAYDSVYIGKEAGSSNQGIGCIGVGKGALKNWGSGSGLSTVGQYNIAIGHLAGSGSSPTGEYNVMLGHQVMYARTSGSTNVAIGKDAGGSMTTGSDNTLLGSDAGKTGTNDLTTGSNNILIGHDAAASSATVSNEITLGDSNITALRCADQSIAALSDERDKTDIINLELGLDFIDSLKPVKFKWDSREGIAKDGTTEAGFIAQDFQKVQKENDADYLGLVLDSNPDRLEASYGKLIPVLVKAIQELKQEIQTLKQNG